MDENFFKAPEDLDAPFTDTPIKLKYLTRKLEDLQAIDQLRRSVYFYLSGYFFLCCAIVFLDKQSTISILLFLFYCFLGVKSVYHVWTAGSKLYHPTLLPILSIGLVTPCLNIGFLGIILTRAHRLLKINDVPISMKPVDWRAWLVKREQTEKTIDFG